MDSDADCVPTSMDDVLINTELLRRPTRQPAFEAENLAMRELVQQMAINPQGVLQKIAELAMSLCGADSAGISILEAAGNRSVFRWHAMTGNSSPNLLGTLPADASPCGEAVARNETMLFDRPDRRYPSLREAQPRIFEALLAPWSIQGKSAGTLWLLAHTPERKFDSEDARLVQNLAQFASIAYQAVKAIEHSIASHVELEQRVEERTRALSEAFQILRQESADREQAEVQRAIAEQALRESEKLAAVGRLASSIAHEINNPLEAVTNLLYLAGGGTSDSQTTQYIDLAQKELARVSRIATETLRFHRRSTNPAPADIAELVDSVTSLHEARLRHSGIQIERRFRPHHPLLCYPSEIRQVIANLISNAVDAMKNTPEARLLICIREGSHWKTGRRGIRITVADTGAGMDGATKKRVFEAFFTTKEATGTGLGLWVCKEIVQKHDGDLRVQSCHGQSHHGSVFGVFLPYPEPATVRHNPPQAHLEDAHPQPIRIEAHS